MSLPATSTNLYAASREWASRPDDQRFSSLQDLHLHCRHQREISRAVEYSIGQMRVIPADGDMRLASPTGTAAFTNWSFGQLARRVDAPASYLTGLPAPLAAECLNHNIRVCAEADPDAKASILVHKNGGVVVRAVTSPKYNRIWNADITQRLQHLTALGWQVPAARPARPGQKGTRKATAADVLAGPSFGLSIKEGDEIAPAGLYASDRDVFAFLVDNQHRIADGSEHGLARGFFVQNSEVGDSSFKLTCFLYRMVCGNHIVWDVSGVRAISIRHVGDANGRAWAKMEVDLRAYANDAASGVEQKIIAAKALILGRNKEEVLDRLFQRNIASKDQLEGSWEMGEQNAITDGSPDTAWGFAQAMTRFSQTLPYAAARTKIDRAAGEVLALAN